MMMEEECDCAHEQAGQRRLDSESLRPTGASTCAVRVQALSLVAVRNNPSPSHGKAYGWAGLGEPPHSAKSRL